jgi:hypothetical protein
MTCRDRKTLPERNVMALADCRSAKPHVQVRLTPAQIRSLFAAINTAGMLSAGRVRRHDRQQEADLAEAIDALERASGISQGATDEWLLD